MRRAGLVCCALVLTGCPPAYPLIAAMAPPAPVIPALDLVPEGAVMRAEALRGRLFLLVEGPEGTLERSRQLPPSQVSVDFFAQALREAIARANLFTPVDRLEDAEYVLTVVDIRCWRRGDVERGYAMAPVWQLARAGDGAVPYQGTIRAEVDVRSAPGSGRKQKAAALARLYRANLEQGLRAIEEGSRPPPD